MKIAIVKITIVLITLCGAAICAQAETKKKGKTAPAPQVLTIPKDAVQNPDGTYSYTDKEGKKWTYAKTPFGLMKTASPDTPASADTPVSSTSIKAIDKGDTVRFERPSPFGPMGWEKKKSELTDEERHILDAQTAKSEQK
jgi:hypothetical protein